MKKRNILITGGAGFIGVNLASRCFQTGDSIFILDNFSRRGTRENAGWLRKNCAGIKFIEADIRNFSQLKTAVLNKDVIYHLAGQVAVTTSVTNPREDFEINALGTFNLLEAIRVSGNKPIFIYTSTNKVYGGMQDIVMVKRGNRWIYRDYPKGISEDYCLDFHSPYGCSKGAADQYVRDYFRMYDIPTVVFRQSCIYGPHQFGLEDQGWVAWFMIAALLNKPITIYGDGMQVRDVLYIDDLVNAFVTATQNIEKAKGQVFNVGGGQKNTLAVWSEFGSMLEKHLDKDVDVTYGDWRPGDQKVYISNIDKIEHILGWKPTVSVESGIEKLFSWVKKNKIVLSKYF